MSDKNRRKSAPPVGAQHYAPAILGHIRHRAVVGISAAAGIPAHEARAIIKTRMPEHLS